MQIKIRYGYTDGKNWIFQTFTIEEIENGSPYEVLSDNALLKKYKLTTRDMWTGLTDKNGVEVYEGDKVLYRVGKIGIDPVSIQYLIIYYIDSWCFLDTRKKVKSNMPKDFALSFYRTPKRVNQHTWSVIEVIGNIHETPVK